MTTYPFEGGPLDGQRMETNGAHVVKVPIPLPRGTEAFDIGLTFSVGEYERAGNIYRYETLIGDARADMEVTAEAFREPIVRRECRRMLRRHLEELDQKKDVDRIVWVLARDPHRSMFSVAAVVGGRRAEHAAHIRKERRSGIPTML
jgi:hypothetical protein